MHKGMKTAYTIAIISDLIDYLGIGMIPILGDLVDFITAILLYPYLGVYAFGWLVEIVPLVDVVPTFTLLVIAYDMGWLKGVKL